MNKNYTYIAVAVLVIIVAFVLLSKKTGADYRKATYMLDNQPISLTGSSTAKYFGNEAKGDLNADGKEDVAFIFTNSPGGSGTFYYVVVALKTEEGYKGTDAVFLGDRIAPQTTEIKDGKLIVNFAARLPTEPMTATPSVGTSKILKVEGGKLVASAETSANVISGSSTKPKTSAAKTNSNGTLNPTTSAGTKTNTPSTSTLNGSIFRLASYNGVATPADSKYTLSFQDGNLSAKFCNSMGGSYVLDAGIIKSNNLVGTMMYCGIPTNLMDIESKFGSILNFGAKISQGTNSITLSDSKGNTFVFVGFGN